MNYANFSMMLHFSLIPGMHESRGNTFVSRVYASVLELGLQNSRGG